MRPDYAVTRAGDLGSGRHFLCQGGVTPTLKTSATAPNYPLKKSSGPALLIGRAEIDSMVLMSINEILRLKRSQILHLAAKHGARNIRVFGSVARGEAREDSDIDFLVELETGRSLLDHAALWRELEDLLGRKVDVVEPEGLHWYIRDRILHEAIPL